MLPDSLYAYVDKLFFLLKLVNCALMSANVTVTVVKHIAYTGSLQSNSLGQPQVETNQVGLLAFSSQRVISLDTLYMS